MKKKKFKFRMHNKYVVTNTLKFPIFYFKHIGDTWLFTMLQNFMTSRIDPYFF
jgi:hypothetical protein